LLLRLLRQCCGCGRYDRETGGGKKNARNRGKTHEYLWNSNQCGYFDPGATNEKPFLPYFQPSAAEIGLIRQRGVELLHLEQNTLAAL
jgi:hypothetical protein